MLENHHVESQEKFQFLESDIIQLRTALKIQSEQSQLFERKLNNASSQNEAVNRENKILREGKFIFFYSVFIYVFYIFIFFFCIRHMFFYYSFILFDINSHLCSSFFNSWISFSSVLN